MTDTACIFALLTPPTTKLLHLRGIALWQDGQPGPVPYANIKDACEAAKRSGWTLTRLPDEEGVPDGWVDLYDNEWAQVERLMAKWLKFGRKVPMPPMFNSKEDPR